ncbi:hypothetical protein [Bradyrhizobium sp. RT10b]|uniref:hypothetical protein n=1 Tax=Bradyrhizobium sp. RT10b TaxID=3156331 RepID=UPI0033965F35
MRVLALALLIASGSSALADSTITTTSQKNWQGGTTTTSTSSAGTYTMTTGKDYRGNVTVQSQWKPSAAPCRSYQEKAMGGCR